MKYSKIFFVFLSLFSNFFYINCAINYGNMTIDEFVDLINKQNKYKEEEYKSIIDSLIEVLNTYYVYSEITKEPQINIGKVDLIKSLKEINLKNITYLNFYNQVQSIIHSVKDGHLNVRFENINKYILCNPFYFYVTKNGDIKLNSLRYYEKFIDEKTIKEVKSNWNNAIIKINDSDPVDYIINFPMQRLKDDHAQFSMNINRMRYFSINIPFEPRNFKNIKIKFSNGKEVFLYYKILYVTSTTKNFQSFYENEIKIHKNDFLEPTIYEIERKYLLSKNEGRNLQQNQWNLTFENSIKFQVNHQKKVNIIVQNSFSFTDIFGMRKFFGEMARELSKNDYPIIVIEDKNGGGIIFFSSVLQKVLNYKSAMSKAIMSYKYNEKNKDFISNQFAFDIETCSYQSPNSDKKIYSDDFGNGVKHNRTQFFSLMNTYIMVDLLIKGENHNERKPTNIIVYTDGYSFSTTSFFIKDLHESGNAIIVGYNGIPQGKRKTEKFNGSQSPSSVLTLNVLEDNNIKNLKNYNITMRATFGASYDYSYQDNNHLHIPREYTINLIDERSSIFGEYSDSRINEFIDEANKIFNKYNKSCNPDNLNLFLRMDNCTFNDSNLKGGYECKKDGTWSNICKPYYCEEGYQFDTYKKICRKDYCYGKFVKYVIIFILIILLLLVLLIISIFLCCKYCKCCECCHCCKCCKKNVNDINIDFDNTPFIPLSEPHH